MSHLANIVARKYHVWEPDRTIIRDEWRRRFKAKYWRSHKKRDIRHAWLREVLSVHHANQQLCRGFRL